MGKKLKDTKFGKILGKVLKGAIDIIPMGNTVKNIISALGKGIGILAGGKSGLIGDLGKVMLENFDRNGDGKLTWDDFKPIEIAGGFLALAVLAVLASKGIIDIEILKQIAGLFGL